MNESGRLVAPKIPNTISENAKWLGGQGVGAWFVIASTTTNDQYKISRYTPEGKLDCVGNFIIEKNGLIFDSIKPYEITYISHCKTVRIIQKNELFIFNKINF